MPSVTTQSPTTTARSPTLPNLERRVQGLCAPRINRTSPACSTANRREFVARITCAPSAAVNTAARAASSSEAVGSDQCTNHGSMSRISIVGWMLAAISSACSNSSTLTNLTDGPLWTAANTINSGACAMTPPELPARLHMWFALPAPVLRTGSLELHGLEGSGVSARSSGSAVPAGSG